MAGCYSALCILATAVALWAAWYHLVLRNASRQTTPWGPEWLAVALSSGVYRASSWYLRFTHNGEEALSNGIWKKQQQYVVVWHPHGAYTIAALCFVSHFWATGYPGGVRGDRYVCIAPLLFRIPFLSEFLLLCGARSQDSKTFNNLLASGATVGVQPGGLFEQVSTDHTQERVYFPARLGFVRLAMKHGVPILPIYAFGENQLYATTPFTRKINAWFYRNFKIGSVLVMGQYGLPIPYFRRDLHIRFGESVSLSAPNADPTDAQVKEYFDEYMVGLTNLFGKYKDDCLPEKVASLGLKVEVRGSSSSDNGSAACKTAVKTSRHSGAARLRAITPIRIM